MSDSKEDINDKFLFSVFAETNQHLRATDEKAVVVGGSFVSLIGIVLSIIIGKLEISWSFFIFSIFILILGFVTYMIQLWYQRFKQHYIEISRNIASEFAIRNKNLPFWLRKTHPGFSADNFFLTLTSLIILGAFIYSTYLLVNLVAFQLIIGPLIIVPYLLIYLIPFLATRQYILSLDFNGNKRVHFGDIFRWRDIREG